GAPSPDSRGVGGRSPLLRGRTRFRAGFAVRRPRAPGRITPSVARNQGEGGKPTGHAPWAQSPCARPTGRDPGLGRRGSFGGWVVKPVDVVEGTGVSERGLEGWAQALFDGIDDAVFVHDLQGRILEANPAACQRLGYPRDEMLRLSTRDIDDPEFASGF